MNNTILLRRFGDIYILRNVKVNIPVKHTFIDNNCKTLIIDGTTLGYVNSIELRKIIQNDVVDIIDMNPIPLNEPRGILITNVNVNVYLNSYMKAYKVTTENILVNRICDGMRLIQKSLIDVSSYQNLFRNGIIHENYDYKKSLIEYI